MRHPTEGTLRRLVDEPAGVGVDDRRHVADCPVCLAGLAAAQDDAAVAASALDTTYLVDVDAAWDRLVAGAHASEPAAPSAREEGTVTALRPRRRRLSLRNPVVAAVGVAALVAGASAAAAADWIQVFHTDQVTPVSVSEADLLRLPDLSAYGTFEIEQPVDVRPVAGAEEAAQASGLAVPEVAELPRGVTGKPVYQVGDQVRAVFTFSAAQTAEATGGGAPEPPAGLDGSSFRLVAGPGVAEVWSESRGIPALVVARATAPTAYASGVDFDTARDYLLSLPGFPADLADELRAFSGDGTAFPLPVPADEVSTSTAEVDGVPATVLEARDGSLAAVVWVTDGVVNAVAGSLSPDEVLSVAEGLRTR